MVLGNFGGLEWRSAGYYEVPSRSGLILAAAIASTIGGIILGHFCTKYPVMQEFGHAVIGGNYREIPREEVNSAPLFDFNGNSKIDLLDYSLSLSLRIQD